MSGPPDTAVLSGRGTVTVVGRAVIVAPGSPSHAVVQAITAVDAARDPAGALAHVEGLVQAAPGVGVAMASSDGWIMATGPDVQLHSDHVGLRRVDTGPMARHVVGAVRLVLAASGAAVPHAPVAATANGTRSGSGVVIAAEEALGIPAAAVEGLVCTSCRAFVHPLSVHCAACGRVIASARQLDRQPGVPVARIVLDDGRTMPLSGMVIIGRDPSGAPVHGTEGAATLVLTDAQRSVSRSHVVVHVDGWDVVVRDNHGANGTSVRPPSSGEWTLLAPGSAVRLLPGTDVRLGRRTFRLDT